MTGWERLDARVIRVDLGRMLVSLVPMAVIALVFGGALDGSVLWPAAIIAVTGVGAALADLLRWARTRYRITDERVECRTGLVVRGHRSIRRDRIRSVDTTAKLRHRLAGLRVVAIRAGDRTATGETAPLRLDAVSRATAERLQAELPAGRAVAPEPAAPAATGSAIAHFRWQWVPYNAFTVWAFLTGAGLAWGAYWLGKPVGVDLLALAAGTADWSALGLGWTIAAAVLAAGVVGVVGVGVAFVGQYWGFRLSRVRLASGTVLRTSHGLLRTRQVDRDEARLRGVEIREPLPWRWARGADVTVVSTGLSAGGLSSAGGSAILPRVPLADARRATSAVLGDERPLATPLTTHPRAALRRRLGRAVLVGVAAGAVGVVVDLPWLWVVLPVAVGLAVLAYRALGHALVGPHLVTRHGVNRSTVVLRRDAVIGWTFRQSVLQRRLGLVTVKATTAAGRGGYPAPDVLVHDAGTLADDAVPGLISRHLGEMPELRSTVGNAEPPHATRPGN
ncbi:MAG: PH domain-containing protein [Actinophytocola sp.]|uniref:PH domain-containing protein n=1 Tax=Actinophytocola sp. TaxID=1872138 RepID=UPI0013228B37|nr:PH domain-containing protein [Actinophytocola sp.]MPZ80976.1 PH domain-containing protein [Actinophytocola sp.]